MKIRQQGNALEFLLDDGAQCLTVLTERESDRLRMKISGRITPETQRGLLSELRVAACVQKDLDVDITDVQELPQEVRKMLLSIWFRLKTQYNREVRIIGISEQLEQECREYGLLMMLCNMSLKEANING